MAWVVQVMVGHHMERDLEVSSEGDLSQIYVHMIAYDCVP